MAGSLLIVHVHARVKVASLMAEPRRSEKYVNVSPADAGW
jgi:hypothetical protein